MKPIATETVQEVDSRKSKCESMDVLIDPDIQISFQNESIILKKFSYIKLYLNHTEFASYSTIIYIHKIFKVYIYINFKFSKYSSPQVWPYVHCTSIILSSLTFILFTFSYNKTLLT